MICGPLRNVRALHEHIAGYRDKSQRMLNQHQYFYYPDAVPNHHQHS